MALMDNDREMPSVMEYHSVVETADNGIEYHRIFDDEFRLRKELYNP